VSATLQDRLQRLRRPPSAENGPPVGPSELERLERALVGEAPDALSLKARLERLVAAAARGRSRAPVPRPVPLEEMVQGLRVENARGEFFLMESEAHLESFHGDAPLSRFRAIAPGAVAILTGEPDLAGFDLASAVFLDTETTGLAGGTGTAAFLIGIGFVDGDRFRVRQYFMRDYHEEPALLAGLAEDLARFHHLVTFNGRMFDVPLLETRYRLSRDRFPLADAPHLDLLHPARRLWKARLESCRLQSLEDGLLGLRRRGDVPGEEIPQIYFEWVRRRDGRALARVFEHNRLDVISLAALAVLACRWVEEGWADDPRDAYSLARVLDRAQLPERAEVFYRRTLESDPMTDPGYRVAALLRLAARARRTGDWERAEALWSEAAEAGALEALRALAILREHRERDFGSALAAVERALALLAASGDPRSGRTVEGFLRRRRRLLGKLAGASGVSPGSPPAGTPPRPG